MHDRQHTSFAATVRRCRAELEGCRSAARPARRCPGSLNRGAKRSADRTFPPCGGLYQLRRSLGSNCIWEWKRRILLTNNPGLEDQFSELSLNSVRGLIQSWLDRQGGYPSEDAVEEYGFYIEQCFPVPDDRRKFFQTLVRGAVPRSGYQFLCRLAEADLIRSVWTPNFDGLVARGAAGFNITPVEIGIDTQGRTGRALSRGELLCVSLHGDCRYDLLKNIPEELRNQEAALRDAMIEEARQTTFIVSGYSGRDNSLMGALRDAYSKPGNGILYWAGFGGEDVPPHVENLIRHARASGRQAFFVPAKGFDDLLTRIGLHCLMAIPAKKPRRPFRTKLHPPHWTKALGIAQASGDNAYQKQCVRH